MQVFYSVSADKHGSIANLPFSLNVCSCLCPPEKHDCPLDVYFTIDTSETIALQEPPPGSLVESIKVPSVFTVLELEDPQHKVLQFYNVVALRRLLTVLFNVSGVVVGFHQGVCAAFKRRRVQRCCVHQLEHWWTAFLPVTAGDQSHWTQEQLPHCEFK